MLLTSTTVNGAVSNDSNNNITMSVGNTVIANVNSSGLYFESGKKAIYTGAVLQVVQTTTATGVTNSSTSTWANTTLSASITPSYSNSKIFVLIMQEVQVYNTSSYGTGMWQLLRGATVIYTPSSTDNGNIFAFDYGGSGINVFRPTPIMWLDSPNTTSSTTYYTQIKKGTNGGQIIGTNSNSPGSITLMEIAG